MLTSFLPEQNTILWCWCQPDVMSVDIGVNSLESALWSSPPLPEAFTSTQGLFPDFCMSYQPQPSACSTPAGNCSTVYRAKSVAVSYPSPPIFSRSPPLGTNRLLCNLPDLQLLCCKKLGINLSQGMLFRSFFWCESSWSTGTEHLCSRRLDRITSSDPCQNVCFYQSETFKKHRFSSKLNFRRDSSDPTGVILYGISKLTKLLHRKSISKKLVLLVGCWCIYSCTFMRKLLLYLYTWK